MGKSAGTQKVDTFKKTMTKDEATVNVLEWAVSTLSINYDGRAFKGTEAQIQRQAVIFSKEVALIKARIEKLEARIAKRAKPI